MDEYLNLDGTMAHRNHVKTFLSSVFIAACAFASTAHAAKLSKVFNGSMLGTTQRYFESVAGIPRESFMDTHTFIVEGCVVHAFIPGEEVSALQLELSAKCKADLTSFIGEFAPKSRAAPLGLFAKPLTFGQFTELAGPMRYFSDCLRSCGNAFDPSVYALWEGPRAVQFIEALLEVKLVSDSAIDASNAWESTMERAMGEDYVIDTAFNCDDRFSDEAARAFAKIEVTSITLGYGLAPFKC